jgi:DNA-binding transcriptional LysR family regulator
MVASGEIEIGATLLPTGEEFDWQTVCHDPLVVLLPRDHPQAQAARVGLTEVSETPFILFESAFALTRIIVDACRRLGFTPVEAARSGQVDFVTELVAAGMGAAFLPRMLAAQRPHPGVSVVPLDAPVADWHLALIWRRGGYLSHAAQAWLDLNRAHHDA